MRHDRCPLSPAHFSRTALAMVLGLTAAAYTASITAAPNLQNPTSTPKLERIYLPKVKSDSYRLVFSPTGDRFAHYHVHGLELWQTQPLKRLALVTDTPPTAANFYPGRDTLTLQQLQFSPNGQLDYIVGGIHAWISPNLQTGIGGRADQLSPDGRYAVRVGMREGPDFTPQFYGAVGEVFDLRDQRSVCQFPSFSPKGAFGEGWFAVHLDPTGPKPAKPLALCDLGARQGLIMPFGEAQFIKPLIDPKGRWMLVQFGGERFFGGHWNESRLFNLPLPRDEFVKKESPYPCAQLPCGQPAHVGGIAPTEGTLLTSPDGEWVIGLDTGPSIRLLKPPALRLITTLPHAGYDASKGQRTGARRVVFSADGHWLGLQAGKHLYKADLRAEVPQLIELQHDAAEFDLQAIANDGQQWLVHDQDEPQAFLRAALWRERP